MQIKSYKDLTGLSIAQARAAYDAISDLMDEVDTDPTTGKSWRWLYQEAFTKIDTLTLKIEALVGVIAEVSAEHDTAQAEVERLTKVIASYDTLDDLGLRTARDFIKAFNIDVEKLTQELRLDNALRDMKESLKEGMTNMPSVTEDEALAQARRVMGDEHQAEKKTNTGASSASLRKVWRDVNKNWWRPDVWYERRTTQLKELENLGHLKWQQGRWYAVGAGPTKEK